MPQSALLTPTQHDQPLALPAEPPEVSFHSSVRLHGLEIDQKIHSALVRLEIIAQR
jgi:hypothetical protein